MARTSSGPFPRSENKQPAELSHGPSHSLSAINDDPPNRNATCSERKHQSGNRACHLLAEQLRRDLTAISLVVITLGIIGLKADLWKGRRNLMHLYG